MRLSYVFIPAHFPVLSSSEAPHVAGLDAKIITIFYVSKFIVELGSKSPQIETYSRILQIATFVA